MSRMPPMWERLVGQEAAVAALRDAAARGTPAHAYLFCGPEGVGRMPAALALAASLNCPERGCGSCTICARVLRRAHPDVHVILPEGPQILVGQVRTAREEAFRSPVEGPARVFVIEDAERMNPAAANALLKVLEEPPAGVVFILLTAFPEDLPPTIASRCRRIDFAPLGPGIIRRVLVEHHGVEGARAEWAARVSGNLAVALRLAHAPEAPAQRAAHLDLPGRLARGGPAEAVRAAAEVRAEVEEAVERLRGRQREEAAEAAAARGEGRGTAAGRKRMEERHRREIRGLELTIHDSVLGDLASFYRDLLVAGAGVPPEALVNREVAERIAAAALRTDPAWLLAALDWIAATRRALARNAAPALAIEALFMDLGTPRVRRR